MFFFLDNVKYTESKNGGATYYKEFVELLLKWKKVPKPADDQKAFLTWLERLTEKIEDNIQKVNKLYYWLKKEKKCAVVVCLSMLGYKNKNTPDDITLAEKSNHLDIIIGGHAENFKAQPYIVLNSNQEEVIIHAAAGNVNALGKIEIDFDWQGRKRNISFSDQIAKQTTSAA